MARARNSRWLHPRCRPKRSCTAFEYPRATDRPTRSLKAGLDVGALGVRVALHVGGGVDDGHVGATDHDAQLHPVQVAWPQRATGPGPLVEQRPDDGEVVAALEDLHRDGAAVDGVLVRARRRPERGKGRSGTQAPGDCDALPASGATATSLKLCRMGASRFHPMRVTDAVRR